MLMVDLCESNVISIITCQLNKPIDKPKEIYEILSSKPLKVASSTSCEICKYLALL